MWGKSKMYLSEKEVSDFFNGKWEVLEEAAKRRRRNSRHVFNVFDGLVYQKEYEIPKKNIQLKKELADQKDKFSKLFRAKIDGCEKDYLVEVCSGRPSKDRFKALLSEVKMLCYVSNHVNIVGLRGCYSSEIRAGVLWVAREYFNKGPLIDYLQKPNEGKDKEIDLNEMVRFAKEIACGMEYLSDHNVVHGDLKAKHVYLDQHKICKLGKFGLCRKLLEYEMLKKKRREELLPWRWMACETLQSLKFTIQSDVWSYGVTIWEVFSQGEVPYGETTPGFYYYFVIDLEHGRKLASPAHATTEIYELMQRCWNLDPQKRPSFEELQKFFLEMLSSTEKIITL